MQKPYLFQALKTFLTENREPEAREFCRSLHPEDLAALLPDFTAKEQLRILAIIGHDAAADILSRCTFDDQIRVAALLQDTELAAIITCMPSDDRVDVFKRLPAERGEQLLGLMAQTEREDIRKLGSYQEGTAGSIMSSDYATLTPELTVHHALEKLRLEAPDKETIYYVYVIDARRRLRGFVSLRKLITSRSEARVGDIMLTNPVFARATDDQEEVADKLNKYDLLAIPVINGNDALAGIVTFDDIQDVMIEETTEDFHRMGGLSHKTSPDLAHINMLDAGWWLLISKRLPWLLVLVFMTKIFFRQSNPIYAMFASLTITSMAGVWYMHRAFKEKKHPNDTVQRMSTKDILSLSLPMLMTTTMTFIIGQTGVIILGIYRPEADVGYYAVAVKLATLTTFVLQAINSMAAPKFSELFHSGKMDELFRIAKKSTKLERSAI